MIELPDSSLPPPSDASRSSLPEAYINPDYALSEGIDETESRFRKVFIPIFAANLLLASLLVGLVLNPDNRVPISTLILGAAGVLGVIGCLPFNRRVRGTAIDIAATLLLLASVGTDSWPLIVGPIAYALLLCKTWWQKESDYTTALPLCYGPLAWITIFPDNTAAQLLCLLAVITAAVVCLLKSLRFSGVMLTLAAVAVSFFALRPTNQGPSLAQVAVIPCILLVLFAVYLIELFSHRSVARTDATAPPVAPSNLRVFVGQIPFACLSFLIALFFFNKGNGGEVSTLWGWFLLVVLFELPLAWMRPYAFGGAVSWIGIAFCVAWSQGSTFHDDLAGLVVLFAACAATAQLGQFARNGFLRRCGLVLLVLNAIPYVYHHPVGNERAFALLSLALVYLLSIGLDSGTPIPWWRGFVSQHLYTILFGLWTGLQKFLEHSLFTRFFYRIAQALISWLKYAKGGEFATLCDAAGIYSFAALAVLVVRADDWSSQAIPAWLGIQDDGHFAVLWAALAWGAAGIGSYALGALTGRSLQRAAGFFLILVPAVEKNEWAGRDLVSWAIIGTVAGMAYMLILLFPVSRKKRPLSPGRWKLPEWTTGKRRATIGIILGLSLFAFGLGETCPRPASDREEGQLLGVFPSPSKTEEAAATQKQQDAEAARQAQIQAKAAADEKTLIQKDLQARQAIVAHMDSTLEQEAADAIARGGQRDKLGMVFVAVPGTSVKFSIWDVRVRDYREFIRNSHYNGQPNDADVYPPGDSATALAQITPDFAQTPNDPVIGVSCDDAEAFCGWLTRQDQHLGKIRENQHYRLPRLEEWGVAAGIADRLKSDPNDEDAPLPTGYFWGKGGLPDHYGNLSGEERKGELDTDGSPVGFIQGYRDYFSRTSPVGAFPPNQAGLYDMVGNVETWCGDGLFSTTGSPFVVGAAWTTSNMEDLLISKATMDNGTSEDRTKRYSMLGFRCVLTAPGQP